MKSSNCLSSLTFTIVLTAALSCAGQNLSSSTGVPADGGEGTSTDRLFRAVKGNQTEILVELISDGVDINMKNDADWTPLHIAANNRAYAAAALLLNHGANVNAEDDTGWTPLYVAVQEDDRETALLLLDHGAAINEAMLFEAARLKAPETAALLIERGVPINAKDGADWTALHYALADGNDGDVDKLAMMLIEHGADVNAATALVAWTPLHLAASLNKPHIVAALITRGAKVNAQTRIGGWTPLHLALQQTGAEAVVATLLAAGAEDRMSDASKFLPAFIWGGRFEQSIEEISIPLNSFFWVGGYSVEGAFTAAGASERLVVEGIGFTQSANDSSHLVGLIDKDGRTLPLWIADGRYYSFERLCLDPLTELHHAMFIRYYSGSAMGSRSDTVYMYYDADKKTLMEGFSEPAVVYGFDKVYTFEEKTSPNETRVKSSAWPQTNGVCRWRTKMAAIENYLRTLDTLRNGSALTLVELEKQSILPSWVIPASTVQSSLATLGSLPPYIAVVLNGLLISDPEGPGRWIVDAPQWEIVVVNGIRIETTPAGAMKIPLGSDSVVLVHDKEREEWRSVYLCGDIEILDFRDNTLAVVGLWEDCPGLGGGYRPLAVDLLTYEIQRNIDLDAFGL